jgi:hypothetical protein
MEDSGWNQPACSRFEAVGLGKIKDSVITLIPFFEAPPDILLLGAGLKSKIGMRENSGRSIELRRKIVALRLAFAAHKLCLFLALMQVMRYGAEIVKKLTVDRPAMVLVREFSARMRDAI